MDEKKAKELLGDKACECVEHGMLVGLGTGSTARCFIESLGLRVQDGLDIRACCTSHASTRLAIEHKIPILSINKVTGLDLVVDGCDQFDQNKQMIKGLGGALLREKMLARVAKKRLILCTVSKEVKTIGCGILPVEVVPVADQFLSRQIEAALGYASTVRLRRGIPYVTDNQNHILDLEIPDFIQDPHGLEQSLRSLPGVVETGLFLDLDPTFLVISEHFNIRRIP